GDATAAAIAELSKISGSAASVAAAVSSGDATAAAIAELSKISGSAASVAAAVSSGDATAAAIAELSKVNAAIGGIASAVRDGRLPPAPVNLEVDVAGIVAALEAAAAKLDGSQRSRGERATGDTHPQEIRVVNKIPDTFLYVMKEQFEIMQSWIEPFAQVNARQDGQLTELQQTLDKLTHRWGRVIDKLENSDRS
ncbi:hypothetical protein, partial [Phycisphaera mikurensis]